MLMRGVRSVTRSEGEGEDDDDDDVQVGIVAADDTDEHSFVSVKE